jgi:hypothetical protein
MRCQVCNKVRIAVFWLTGFRVNLVSQNTPTCWEIGNLNMRAYAQ